MRDTAENESDMALLAEVAAGSIPAMRSLYHAHAEPVQRFVRTRVRDDFEAADIVQETMLSVWRDAAKFEGRSSVRSWIFTLARNKAVDHIRKHARVSVVEPDETVPDDAPDAETVIAASEDAQRVRGCVEKLPERQRAVIHLAFFEDLTYAQIAEIEDTPEGTIKTRIFHAKKLLMRCLSALQK